MNNWSDVWLIVPVYNEATVLADVIRNARETFSNIVCIDDGSKDSSAEQIRLCGAHLVKHPVNLGQGAAIQTGVEYALAQPGSGYFATFDADGQHQVDDVVRMLKLLKADDMDIVVGTRFRGDTATHVPWIKRSILKTVVMTSARSRRLHLTDAHNGLRVFNRTVAEQMNITLNRMAHASEIMEMIERYDWHVAEESVDILYTEYSRSKGQSIINGINILFDTVFRGRARN